MKKCASRHSIKKNRMPGSTLQHQHSGDMLTQMVSRRLFLAGLTLALAFAVLLATHFWLLREEFNAGIAAKVQITAANLSQALRAGENEAAKRILVSLQDLPVITGATLFDANRRPMVDYQTSIHGEPPVLNIMQDGDWLDAYWQQSLALDNRTQGTLVVRASMHGLLSRLSWFAGIGMAAMLISLSVTWTAFFSLRRKVADTEDDLKRMAWYDPVTRLPNRNLFQQRLRDALQEAKNERHGVAILFIDLDNFKLVNDTLGHDAGDALLITISERLRGLLRAGDTVCRMGGDEFVILLHPAERGDAEAVAQRALATISHPVTVYDQQVYVGGSIGIASYPDDGLDAVALLRCADTAMYQAKDNGRNTFQFYTPDMNLKALQHFAIETSLRQALDKNEMRLYYQPLVDVETRAILGVEALLRWKSAEFGTFASGEFIAIAEQSGLINQLGTWALNEACRQMRVWRDEGLGDLTISVNLSPRQFHTGDMVALVRKALADSGLEPGMLELEITESVLIKYNAEAIDKLNELGELGVKLAIDDFGTGYSSLSYLKRLPIHRLKIDKSFVRESHIDPDDAAIATAIIGMAKGLGIGVTAEGVENEEQLAFLKQAGCQIVQGYYFGTPLPADDLAKLVRQVRHKKAGDSSSRFDLQQLVLQ
jgi:diguanylate cyclase (GGDEF)-like protein